MIIITNATKNESKKQFQHGVRIGFFSTMNWGKEPGSTFTLWVRFQKLKFSCFYSVAQSYPTLCDPRDTAHQASHSFTISFSLLKLMFIELVMPSNHLILCRSLLLLPSISPSIRVFSNESALHIRQPKYWGFSFSISPSNEYLELISFRIDWFDLLAVQGTLKSLLQHHSSKVSTEQQQTPQRRLQ